MLELLRISNLALIEDMELEFSPGLNVLTGETGAGKSFILRAINFLLGDKLEASMVRGGADKAVAEALFTTPEGDIILRRELVAETGRSRIYLNNSLASQDTIKELRASLLIHASQHGQQKLLQPAFQAQLLDNFLPEQSLIAQKDEALTALRSIMRKKEDVMSRAAALEERRDVLEFQQKEIDKVDPKEGEEEALEERRSALRHLEDAHFCLDEATDILLDQNGLIAQIGVLESSLAKLAGILPEYEPDVSTISDNRAHLNDLALRLRRQSLDTDEPDYDPEKIDARLFELSQLKRRLRKSLPEILDLKGEIEENLAFLDDCSLVTKQLEREEKEAALALAKVLEALNAARKIAAEQFSKELMDCLRDLGFSEHVHVEFEFTPQILHAGSNEPKAEASLDSDPGAEPSIAPCIEQKPRLLWKPNPGQPAQPLDKIASGGELSRFLLAVIAIMAKNDSPTLIFDEVDSGVGGLTLNFVATRIKQLAQTNQILLITHWPQLAAVAHTHFQVSKEVVNGETHTRCHKLKKDEIMEELARMAGGGTKGEALAKELVLF